MNRMIINGLLVVLVVLVIIPMVALASWDTVPQPKPAQDIIDALMPVPTPTLDQYGHTERTKVIFNIAKVIEVLNTQEARIKALEEKVAELEKPIVDSNSTPVYSAPNSVIKEENGKLRFKNDVPSERLEPRDPDEVLNNRKKELNRKDVVDGKETE